MKKIQPINSLISCTVAEWEQTPVGVHGMKGCACLSPVSKVCVTAMCLDMKNIGYSGLGISGKN